MIGRMSMKGLVFAGVALLPVMSAAAEMKSAAADTKAAAADAGSTSLRGRMTFLGSLDSVLDVSGWFSCGGT